MSYLDDHIGYLMFTHEFVLGHAITCFACEKTQGVHLALLLHTKGNYVICWVLIPKLLSLALKQKRPFFLFHSFKKKYCKRFLE